MSVHLVTGRSWEDAERLCGYKVSRHHRPTPDATNGKQQGLRRRGRRSDPGPRQDHRPRPHRGRVDGSLQKSPGGGEGTGKNPTDRAKPGWKWSILTDAEGIPFGWPIDGANRHDSILLAPTLADAERGSLEGIETIWLDRGYDSDVTRRPLADLGINDAVIAKKRKSGSPSPATKLPIGLRWPVERTNSWLSNFGPLRRNTDRKTSHRLAQFALALTFLLTTKLIDWRNRWSPGCVPIR